MNKELFIKRIRTLKNDIKNGLNNQNKDIQLYINTWVIGDLEMLENKAKNQTCYIYPENATYKDLWREFESNLFCDKNNEKIKEQTRSYLLTDKNIKNALLIKNMIFIK